MNICLHQLIVFLQVFHVFCSLSKYYYPANGNSFQAFKVVGVVGTDSSKTSSAVAKVLHVANLALLSFWATSDHLSVKQFFPNFWRIVAPDSYLVLALTDFLKLHNFNYVSIMFDNSIRSLSTYWTVKKHLALSGICVSKKIMVRDDTDVVKLLREILLDKTTSRIMVSIGGNKLAHAVISKATSPEFQGRFLWVGNDFWEVYIHNNRAPKGALALHYDSVPSPDFSSYLRGMDIKNNKNPWFLKAFLDTEGCNEFDCIKKIIDKEMKNPSIVSGLIQDSCYVYAYALDTFLKLKCPGLRGKMVSDCFFASLNEFSAYISKVKFIRNSREFEFTKDQHGFDSFTMIQSSFDKSDGPIKISQYSIKRQKTVMLSQISTSQLSFSFSRLEAQTYCMIPCLAGEYRYYISRCCWKCRKCQENQKTSANLMACEGCPPLHWPEKDKNSTMTCEKIPPDHFDIHSFTSAILIAVACMGILSVLLILNEYMKNKSHPIIKASSLEISVIQLLFILLGYLAVPFIVDRPTALRCTTGALLFTISFNVLYFTMLIKAIRVYRIFSLSKRGGSVSFTSPAFQVSISAAFFGLEVARFFMINKNYPIAIGHFQPDFNVKYVEMACTIPSAQLIPFCVFALILLFLCSIYAFKTQTLPSNFKESRFVSMCVMTTLLIWAVFMPNYFTTQHFQLKMFYILLALLINHSTALLFLFLTRIFALRVYAKRYASFKCSVFLCEGRLVSGST